MLKQFSLSKSARFGIPFVLLCLGGSFGLREFTDIKYQFYKKKKFVKEVEDSGANMKSPSEVTLEKIFEKVEQLDVDNWENKRGPRPWEQDNELYREAVQRAEKLKEIEGAKERPLIT